VQQIEQEQMGRDVLFVVWSKEDMQTVQKAIQSISEVEIVELHEWMQEGEASQRGPNVIQKTEQQKTTTTTEKRKMSTVRVDTEKLDDLMNLVSELAIDKTRLERIRTEVPHVGLSETVDHMSRLSSQLQELIMSIRMVPVETVFNRFPRMVRDTSQQLGKEVEFTIIGQDTELDRTVVEEIGDPIMHMLRNSLDHGIESMAERRATGKPDNGHITLRAYAAGNHVFIEVEDDGHGIDRDRVFKKALEKGLVSSSEHLTDHQVYQLLFASGFSTADAISDLSGRGVGLDVVKTKIEALSGKVDVFSEPGKGTKFVVRLPMTLAIMDGLMVQVDGHPYLIPINSITETGVLQQVQTIYGREVMRWRGKVIPLVRVREVFHLPPAQGPEAFLLLSRDEHTVALVVDELLGQLEAVLKALGQVVKQIPYFAGATILGDGSVALILDANAFMEAQWQWDAVPTAQSS
jgi:two-component system chemotaxis sensor kinase CheA